MQGTGMEEEDMGLGASKLPPPAAPPAPPPKAKAAKPEKPPKPPKPPKPVKPPKPSTAKAVIGFWKGRGVKVVEEETKPADIRMRGQSQVEDEDGDEADGYIVVDDRSVRLRGYQ